MFFLRITLLFALAHACMCIEVSRHGYDYKHELLGWLKLHKEPADWFNARIQCHMEGAYLASPWSPEFTSAVLDMAFLQDLFDEYYHPDSFVPLHRMYSGLKTTYAEGAFILSNGKPTISMNPRDLAELERCGIFFNDGTTSYVPCDEELPYVCYIPESEEEPTPAPYINLYKAELEPDVKIDPLDSVLNRFVYDKENLGISEENLGYKTIVESGQYYKLHEEAVDTVDEADRVCETEGANLAVVDDDKAEHLIESFFILKYNNRPINTNFISQENPDYAFYENSEMNVFTKKDAGHLYAYVSELRGGVRQFICEKKISEQEHNTVKEPEITTDAVSELEYDIVTEAEIETDTVSELEYEIETDTASEPKYEIVTEADIENDAISEPKYEILTEPEIETDAVSEPEYKTVTEPEIETEIELEPAYLREKNFGYEMFGETGPYYKFHEKVVYSAEEAKKICEAEGAQLDYILDIVAYDDSMYGYPDPSRGVLERFMCEKKIYGQEPNFETGTKPDPEIKAEIVSEPNYETEIDTETEPIPESESGTESTLTLAPHCGENILGYEFSHQTGHCYKFHAQAVKTWFAAKSACEEEGAHLAIINSDQEAQVIIKLFEKYPPEEIHGAQFPDTAAIGYSKTVRNGWQTIEGETLEQAGYEAWRPEAPHAFAEYGFICRDGLLYGYVPAVRDMPFICEKKPLWSET